MPTILDKLNLDFNPFQPSASGPPVKGALSIPKAVAEQTIRIVDALQSGGQAKIIVVKGDYGIGKTCLLHWMQTAIFPTRRVKPFYFDNPGVQFYDLANALLRTIGRKDFAKFIWELAGPFVSVPYHQDMFLSGFESYLAAQSDRKKRLDVTIPLQEAILRAGIAVDEQIAHCLARIVTDSVRKPYFEYRDFVPRQKGSLVAEAEEAPYFGAILKTIVLGTNAGAVAFLIDEFEEIGLQKRLTRRAAGEYLSTLKRLVNLSERGDCEFWIVLSMTPDAYETTIDMDPALAERFSRHALSIDALSDSDAIRLIRSRVAGARPAGADSEGSRLFPFPEELLFRPVTYSNPRRLVKTCFYAVADATEEIAVPFSGAYLRRIEDKYYFQSGEAGGMRE